MLVNVVSCSFTFVRTYGEGVEMPITICFISGLVDGLPMNLNVVSALHEIYGAWRRASIHVSSTIDSTELVNY